MRSRLKKQEEEPVPVWQTIYSSLILIMLMLFVMLVSYSVTDKKKMAELKSNFKAHQDEIKDGKDQGGGVASVRAEELAGAAWVKEAIPLFQQREIKSGLAGAISMERTGRGLKFKLKSDVLFPSGQAAINRKFYPYLDEMIRVVREGDLFVSIEGHTDDVPIRNAAVSSNWELSAARAMSVLRYCLEEGKIPAGRLSATGFASYRPLVPEETPQGRMQNRRIEIYLAESL